MGVFVGGWPPEGRLSMHEKLLELYAAGKIRPTIGAEIGFDEVPAGLEALANRRGRGKLVARITS
jgi:NADPH:quinone reductase-like Zn-dependent oxidoreductase